MAAIPLGDPRNEDDYDTWDYGTEPLPHDHTWVHGKGADNSKHLASHKHWNDNSVTI